MFRYASDMHPNDDAVFERRRICGEVEHVTEDKRRRHLQECGPEPMKRANGVLLLLLLCGIGLGQEAQDKRLHMARPPLDVKVDHFDALDAILRDGVSELSVKNIDGLHLGFEEIIRDRIQDDPRGVNVHFSLSLENKSVREIIDALCQADPRYTWSEDAPSINVYPRATPDDTSDLLNLRIGLLKISAITDPDQALTPLSKLFPNQQVGYFGPGLGNNTYIEPWTTTFEDLTVRQFINRVAEHMGPRTSWIWQGGKGERMFTFLKGGFHTSHGRQ